MGMELNLSVIVLLLVFGLIAVRQVGRFKLKIWQIMLGGAIAVLVTLQISIPNAMAAINVDVMLFLFGMFVVGRALEESGYLYHLSYIVFRRAKSVDQLVILILFSVGLLSAFLMNDTLAIIGTPLVLYFATKHRISPKMLLLTLAFAVTIGSAMSPIGNPQNLLIAINGNIADPFLTFFSLLLIPTIINLLLAYLLLKLFFPDEFKERQIEHEAEGIKDPDLAFLCKISLVIIGILVVAKIVLVLVLPAYDFRLTYIALLAAAPILLFSKQRFEVVKRIDWATLVFFASMFVLMASVWASGFFQSVLGNGNSMTSVPMILGVSVSVSQFISNVPFVALYMPLLQTAGASNAALVALAAGSTIAGNLFILGAASNVIIIQNAEKKGETLKFLEFAKVGVPLTLLNCLIYWIFLSVL